MKKIDNKGFVLAETLIVTVFLVAMFAMIYTNYYPLIGEYEKRETYDDVDGKYAAYWVKKMIEDEDYVLSTNKGNFFNTHNFVRFECTDIQNADKKNMCIHLMQQLEIEGCNSDGRLCEAYITTYQIGSSNASQYFKGVVTSTDRNKNNKITHEQEANGYGYNYYNICGESSGKVCGLADKKIFSDKFKDYVLYLPDYSRATSDAKYRVIIMMHTTKDNNDYYSYSTIEVNK